MNSRIAFHGVTFEIDTMDWSDSKSRQIAEDEMIFGLSGLEANDVRRIAAAWTDGEAEYNSRSAGDEVSGIIKAIESTAKMVALAGWEAEPDTGHNCSISIFKALTDSQVSRVIANASGLTDA